MPIYQQYFGHGRYMSLHALARVVLILFYRQCLVRLYGFKTRHRVRLRFRAPPVLPVL